MINHLIQYAFRNKLLTHFDKFDFKKTIIKQEAIGKRDTFTDKEYDKLTRDKKTVELMLATRNGEGGPEVKKSKSKSREVEG